MTAQRQRLTDLQSGANFISRHIGPRDTEISDMLDTVGAGSLDDLMDKVIPPNIRARQPLNLPTALSERNALSDLRRIAGRNRLFTSMIGMGYYGTVTPPVILRNVLENPGWYTAYTPYQAEISQGRLEALLNFQQMDGPDRARPRQRLAARRSHRRGRGDGHGAPRRRSRRRRPSSSIADTHPQTLAVLRTRARGFGFELVVGDPGDDLEPETVFAALLSYPGSSGAVRDYRERHRQPHGAGAMSIMATDLLALPAGAAGRTGGRRRHRLGPAFRRADGLWRAARGLLRHPRRLQARHVRAASSACRSMPGGRPALRMALQTREQHIRREKATSNICTAQVAAAVIRGMFAVYQGPDRHKEDRDRPRPPRGRHHRPGAASMGL
jgi:glycine dehydrogenase